MKTVFRAIVLLTLFIFLQFCLSCAQGGKALMREDSDRISDMAVTESKAASAPRSRPKKRKLPGAMSYTGLTASESRRSAARPRRTRKPTQSGLKAGFSDDNRQFNYFINFLEKYKSVDHYPLNVSERIMIEVLATDKTTVPNAIVRIFSDRRLLEEGTTLSDGTYLFFPSQYHEFDHFTAKISHNQSRQEIRFDRQSKRYLSVHLDTVFSPQEIPVDVLFVFDTTGSMGEEIRRLKKTIELIHLNLNSTTSSVPIRLRFGMVLYRDQRDRYLTRTIPLTSDLQAFLKELNAIEVDGGGDRPEDLQSALEVALTQVSWDPNGVRAGFIVTDAPPHLDYGQEYTYVTASQEAKRKGIKLFSIGTGGLDIMGEYILRQISQYTHATYIFLSYGEKGESKGGRAGSVSHHTGANFQTDKLEAIIIKLMREEISSFAGKIALAPDDFFEATKIEDEAGAKTLKNLFERAVSQLIDYSSRSIAPGTAMALLPIAVQNSRDKANAEYFSHELLLVAGKNRAFKLVERDDIQQIEDEIDYRIKDLIAGINLKELGKKTGAHLLLLGELFKKPSHFELYLKILHVETGEILAVTKAKIDTKLGI